MGSYFFILVTLRSNLFSEMRLFFERISSTDLIHVICVVNIIQTEFIDQNLTIVPFVKKGYIAASLVLSISYNVFLRFYIVSLLDREPVFS